MTDHIKIGDIKPRQDYVAAAAQIAFDTIFPFFAAADVKVYVDGVLQGAGFTVSGAGLTAGGTVTFAVAPATGAKITLLREIAVARTTDFQDGGAFYAKTINDELDRQTAFVQQVQERADRALRVDAADPATILTVPPPAARRGGYPGFDGTDAANLTVLAGPAAGASVSVALKPVVEAATLAAGRTALGLGTAAVKATATSGEAVPLLNTSPVWSGGVSYFDRGGSGAYLVPRRTDAHGNGAHLFQLEARGKDSAGNEDAFAALSAFADVATDAAEDGRIAFLTRRAGAWADRVNVGAGLFGAGLADPGAGKANFAGYQLNGADLPFVKSFTSAEQTVTSSGLLTLAHGLGAAPSLVFAELVCKTAEHGYAAGDRLPVFPMTTAGADYGSWAAIVPDATNLVVRFNNSGSILRLANKTTGVVIDPNWANWKIVFKAYL